MGILYKDLIAIADTRIKDAEVLVKNERYDGANYLCGYAIELVLKARLCKYLKWAEFPESKNEFNGRKDLKTHNFDVLLSYTGMERKIKRSYFADWSIIGNWTPTQRYKPPGVVAPSEVKELLASTKRIVTVLAQ